MILFNLLIYMNFVIVKTVKRSRKMFITHDTIPGTVMKENGDGRMETAISQCFFGYILLFLSYVTSA